uniref:Uncharacterized protein n=1 Tax=Arundo donax TaxID=35708 RepID=A0A0A9F3J6_ARUDO
MHQIPGNNFVLQIHLQKAGPLCGTNGSGEIQLDNLQIYVHKEFRSDSPKTKVKTETQRQPP